MSDELKRLLEASRKVTPTPEHLEEQRRSFAYGNTRFENDRITREHIDRAAESLKAAKK